MLETLKYWDRALFFKINGLHSHAVDNIMWVISNDFFIYPFIILFLLYIFKKMDGKRVATLILGIGLCVACADMSTNLIKHTVKRYRPSHNLEIKDKVHILNNYKGGQFGFFSSHAANSFAITTLFFLSATTFLGRRKRMMFYLLPILIGYSRIYLGVHYPSDILFGALNGILFGWLVYKILSNYFFKDQLKA